MDEKTFNLPPAPAGVRSWIIKDVIEKTYIIYNKKKNDEAERLAGELEILKAQTADPEEIAKLEAKLRKAKERESDLKEKLKAEK